MRKMEYIYKILKIRAEINDMENRKRIWKINEAKSWLFEKINRDTFSEVDQEKKKLWMVWLGGLCAGLRTGGRWFYSRSGLWARSPVGGMREATTH